MNPNRNRPRLRKPATTATAHKERRYQPSVDTDTQVTGFETDSMPALRGRGWRKGDVDLDASHAGAGGLVPDHTLHLPRRAASRAGLEGGTPHPPRKRRTIDVT